MKCLNIASPQKLLRRSATGAERLFVSAIQTLTVGGVSGFGMNSILNQ